LLGSHITKQASIVSGLMLTDISGKTVIRKEYTSVDINEFKEELDVSNLAPGIYLLQVQTTSGIITQKVSVVHD
jgi:hypothetical protein